MTVDPSDLTVRVARVIGEAVFLLLAGVNALILLFIGGMSCDESCTNYRGEGNPAHDSWKVTADAWQWDLIGWLGLAGLICAVGCVIAARLPAGATPDWCCSGRHSSRGPPAGRSPCRNRLDAD